MPRAMTNPFAATHRNSYIGACCYVIAKSDARAGRYRGWRLSSMPLVEAKPNPGGTIHIGLSGTSVNLYFKIPSAKPTKPNNEHSCQHSSVLHQCADTIARGTADAPAVLFSPAKNPRVIWNHPCTVELQRLQCLYDSAGSLAQDEKCLTVRKSNGGRKGERPTRLLWLVV